MSIKNIFQKNIKAESIYSIITRKNRISRYSMLIIGVFLLAVTYNLFMIKNDFVAGGVGGISIIFKDIINPTTLILVLSLFLLILSFMFLGKEKTKASILGTLLFPIFVDLTAEVCNYIHIENNDLLLIAIFVGFIQGIASGLIFKAGFTTGGTDILNQIVAKYAKTSIGSAMLVTDGLIVLSAGFFFGWTKVMYAIIILYMLSFIADKVILGISSSKAFYIVTEKEDEVRDYILNVLGHGVTILGGKGGYTNERQKVFMCVIPTREYFKVKEGLEEIDSDSFFIVTDAYQSFGGS